MRCRASSTNQSCNFLSITLKNTCSRWAGQQGWYSVLIVALKHTHTYVHSCVTVYLLVMTVYIAEMTDAHLQSGGPGELYIRGPDPQWEWAVLGVVPPFEKHWDQFIGLLCKNGRTFAFAQYVNLNLLASAVCRCSSMQDRTWHVQEIC